MSGVAGGHHVLGIEHLLSQFRNSKSSVLLRAPGCEGSKPWHEEVETREGHHVDSQLPQVGIKLTWEPEAGGDTRHRQTDKVIEITIGRVGQLQSPAQDILCMHILYDDEMYYFYLFRILSHTINIIDIVRCSLRGLDV